MALLPAPPLTLPSQRRGVDGRERRYVAFARWEWRKRIAKAGGQRKRSCMLPTTAQKRIAEGDCGGRRGGHEKKEKREADMRRAPTWRRTHECASHIPNKRKTLTRKRRTQSPTAHRVWGRGEQQRQAGTCKRAGGGRPLPWQPSPPPSVHSFVTGPPVEERSSWRRAGSCFSLGRPKHARDLT